MNMRPEFVFENYEEFFGDVDQVQKTINRCDNCGNNVVYTHITDYADMIVQESSRCPLCGSKKMKKIHSLN